MRFRVRQFALLLSALVMGFEARAGDCAATDFFSLPIPDARDPIATSLELAYPGLTVDRARKLVITPSGDAIPLLPARPIPPEARLDEATIGDQFAEPYPLEFVFPELTASHRDPGRIRNEAFFRSLYFSSEAAARTSLVSVAYHGRAIRVPFFVTLKFCIHRQLEAVFARLSHFPDDLDQYFKGAGGSFNWRQIDGTARLSSHSFGIAIDINPDIGQYWRWTGAKFGKVGPYENRVPQEIVESFERYGFIWGGKWRHFDGMHFEYRPELILHARILRGALGQ